MSKSKKMVSQARILVVEDEQIVAKDIRRRLEALGYEVVDIVASGEDAIVSARTHKPNLVLMDIMLRGKMDGVQAAEEIRARMDIPVIFLTAYSDQETLDRAKITQPFGFILKPFEERELHSSIEMAIYKHGIEQRLRESERRFKTTLQSIGDAVIATEMQGRITFMNAVAERLTGWNAQEVIGKELSAVMSVRCRDQQIAIGPAIERVLREGATIAFSEASILVARNGQEVFIDDNASPIHDEDGVIHGAVIAFRDVTERKKAAEVMLKLKKAVEHSDDAVFMTDMSGIITYTNPAFTALYGYTEHEVVGKVTPRILKSGRLGEKDNEQFWQRLGAKEVVRKEIVNQTKDGLLLVVEGASNAILDDSNEIIGYLSIQRNVTERKQTEEYLRQSEKRYRRYFEQDLAGNFISSPEGNILDCNPAFLMIFGFISKESALKTNLVSLFKSQPEGSEVLLAMSKKRILQNVERTMVKQGGETLTVLSNLVGEYHSNNQLLQVRGYLFDITDRKQLEQQLLQVQKLESLGTLVSGISHDFNNILNNILGFSHQLRKYVSDPARVLRYSETIEKSANRGAELATQLLSLVRQKRREESNIDTIEVVDELLSLARETFPKNIIVQKRVAGTPWPILGTKGELYQTLLNLALNARDAMADGGLLTIEVTNILITDELRPRLINPESVKTGKCLEIKVIDTGVGISESVIGKIFDPFFTTKERGSGTGLGLTIVFNIIRNHRGTIFVESKEGKGTTFTLYFPVAQETTDTTGEPGEGMLEEHGADLILVVDDEESMQMLARDLLEEQGYKVLTAGDGLEALEIYKKQWREISLVILDLVMPKMDGGKAYVEMKKINPEIRAFFCTGFTSDEVITSLLDEEHLRALQKPFRPDSFVRMVRTVMQEAR
ncbi:MAG: PAS domain S-box protein [Ignavibacteriales bacterium]|nr:PAS domain S-box protein [Ignavibacteriales bacterium]